MTLARPFRNATGQPNELYRQIGAIDEMHRLERRKGSLVIEIHYDSDGCPARAWVQERIELNLLDTAAR